MLDLAWQFSELFCVTSNLQVPPLKVFFSNDEDQKYCKIDSLNLGDLIPLKVSGDWFYMSVSLDACNCKEYPGQDVLDRFDFQNVGERNAKFCLADVQIVASGQ